MRPLCFESTIVSLRIELLWYDGHKGKWFGNPICNSKIDNWKCTILFTTWKLKIDNPFYNVKICNFVENINRQFANWQLKINNPIYNVKIYILLRILIDNLQIDNWKLTILFTMWKFTILLRILIPNLKIGNWKLTILFTIWKWLSTWSQTVLLLEEFERDQHISRTVCYLRNLKGITANRGFSLCP